MYSSTLPSTSALDGGGGQHQAPATLPPGKTRYPLYRRLSRHQGRSGRIRKTLPPQGFDPRTVQPVASRYTDWAIPASVDNYIRQHQQHKNLILASFIYTKPMLHTYYWCVFPDDHAKKVETCWSCDILIVKLYVIMLCIFLLLDIYGFVVTSLQDDPHQFRVSWHFSQRRS